MAEPGAHYGFVVMTWSSSLKHIKPRTLDHLLPGHRMPSLASLMAFQGHLFSSFHCVYSLSDLMTSPSAEFTSAKAVLAFDPQNRYHGTEGPHAPLLGRNVEEEGDISKDTAAWIWLQSSSYVPASSPAEDIHLPVLG